MCSLCLCGFLNLDRHYEVISNYLAPLYLLTSITAHNYCALYLSAFWDCHIIADYGYGDLAFAEVVQRILLHLPDADPVLTPVPPFGLSCATLTRSRFGTTSTVRRPSERSIPSA